MKDVTLFAPSNEAWSDSNLNNIIRNRERMREILNLHIVRDRLNTDKIKTNNLNQINQVPTLVDRRFLYFNIFTNRDRNQTITVEGGGVNATIIQADIAATNGFVHIIDKVLGVPYSTVLDKLRTDPMLKAFTMGELRQFANQTAELPTVRGMLRIRVKEEDRPEEYYLQPHSF
uniref:FAS1 domain-containing protein n=1 Tax=Lutzomyia longipalpis TaxID=7200 RepID=A0A1B0EZU3_LUTLO